MKKLVTVFLGLMLSTHALAEKVDLEAVMKEMKLSYKHADSAQNPTEMKQAIGELSVLVNKAKQGDYPAKRGALYNEGFDKLAVALDKADKQASANDLDGARATLKEVDNLRKEYHKKVKQLGK
jgi:soluble cytochrome b562